MFRLSLYLFGILLLASMLTSCRRDAPPPAEETPRLGEVDAPGLHNVYRLTDKLLSGSSPEGDEGFASLQRLGVKTVLSVDGARPDVARARRFGLRYVHLPIGYDGVPEAQGRRIAKAVRDLPGPIYVHCHHGKHRGPAAVAVARLCLDPACSVETALQEMRRAGADPRYVGLYASARELRRPSPADLDALPDDFPESVAVGGFTALMVQIDERWDRIGEARAAGWKMPPAHPDIDPPHEALLLAEGYQESLRLPATRHRPEEFRRLLSEAVGGAKELEAALRAGRGEAAEMAYQRAAVACAGCHAKYRDRPQ
jgi:protein tyrosine phosphatase (PTP) superfamily phosphohydrolase (DUF442 family)/cytochrome c553